MIPVYDEIYKSINTGKIVYVVGIKNNKPPRYKNRMLFKCDVCLIDAQLHIYSEIPLVWFQAIYRRTGDTFSPDDIRISASAKRHHYVDETDKTDNYWKFI